MRSGPLIPNETRIDHGIEHMLVRPMPRRARLRVAPTRLLTSLLACGVMSVTVRGGALPQGSASSRGAPIDKVRVVYRAPPECPDAATFLFAVRERIGSGWEASPDEAARELEITVTHSATESVAHLGFVDAEGRRVSRSLSAATCAEVTSAM